MFENIISNLNKERNVTFVSVSDTVYEGYVIIKRENIKLSIDLGNEFPLKLPIIKIIDKRRLVPHSALDGTLCLFNKDSVMIKTNLPNEMLLESFDRAIEILNMDYHIQKQEVFREFFSYWENQSINGIQLYVNLPDASCNEFKEYIAIGQSLDSLVVSSCIEESKALLINNMKCEPNKFDSFKILCVRIRLRASVLPPQMYSKFTWNTFRNFILKNCTGWQKRQFNQMLDKKSKVINRLILLSIPTEQGDQYACLWLNFKCNKKVAMRNVPKCHVDAVIPFRIDEKYMLTRGCAEISMNKKSVLLVGCGSVGGFLAENLCQCGVKSLDILDKDILHVDNVHRHLLGFNDAIKKKYKADLLKEHLEARFPYVSIDSLGFVDRTAETFLKDLNRLKNYDLIVSATGNPAVDLAINDSLHKLDVMIPFVVCFNEPYGIGGHAVAVLGDGACLRCLYSDPLEGELVPFLGSFVEPGQSFQKTISGCEGSFVEYSVLDSQQTAILTSRLIIDVLNGNCKKTQLCSWVGSATKLMNAGFKTSEYYNDNVKSNVTLISRFISKSKRCLTCGNS